MNLPRSFKVGIRLPSDTSYTLSKEGDIKNDAGILKAYLSGAIRNLLTSDQTQAVSNKTITSSTIDADLNTITNIDNNEIKAGAAIAVDKLAALTASRAVVTDGSGFISAATTTSTEIGYVNGVTSAIQTQIDAKASATDLSNHIADTSTHGTTGNILGDSDTQVVTNKTIDADLNTITNIENADIKAAAAIDATKIANGSVSNTEFQFLDGVTSSIQTQLSAKVTGPGSSVDNTIARFDGTTGGIIQGSGVVVSDTNAVSAITQLDVDNIRTDGNTISSTDTNGNISLAPNGTGIVDVTKDLNVTETARFTFATDSATTGSAAVLGTPGTSAIRVTNASLTSIGTIPAGASGQLLMLENATGADITLLNDTGATSADRIYTGTGATVTLKNQATLPLIYDTTIARWMVAASAGSGGVASNGVSSTKTTDYMVLTSDNGKVINVDPTSNAITITLPSPSAGFIVTVKDITGFASTNNITVYPGANTIDSINGNDIISLAYGAVTYIANSTSWFRITGFSGAAPSGIARGLFLGGYQTVGPVYYNTIDYVTIASLGNATDFGDLTVAREDPDSCSSSTRAVTAGGYTGANSNVIDYVTIASLGNATDFGDLTSSRYGLGACSSSTRGVFGGGFTSVNVSTMDYVTIATTGNATSFGSLTVARSELDACASTTRGLFAGGTTGSRSNVIDYITIASAGAATDFGDLTSTRLGVASCSSAIRGLFGGGDDGAASNTIDYVTIASTSNATDFGDLTQARAYLDATCDATRAIFGGGVTSVQVNTLDYVTIATTGNATDFGDLTVARSELGACSNAHGGL